MRTTKQNKELYKLITMLGIPQDEVATCKESWALNVSSGRTKRTSELTYDEMESLLRSLRYVAPPPIAARQGNTTWSDHDMRMVKKVYAIMHSIGWTVQGRLDYVRLSAFLKEHTALSKHHLRYYHGKDLQNVVSALERIECQKARKKSKSST